MPIYALYTRMLHGEEEYIELYSSYHKALIAAMHYLEKEEPDFLDALLAHGVKIGESQELSFITEDHTMVEYNEWEDGLYIHWGKKLDIAYTLRITNTSLNCEVGTLLYRGND